jgi:hypothetical protein
MAYLLPTVPVFQPSHLEGDPNLATEILPGPPSLASVQARQAAQKKDPKKVPIMYSYLPGSDPGSTYSGVGHGTVVGQDAALADSSRSRSSRTDTACVIHLISNYIKSDLPFLSTPQPPQLRDHLPGFFFFYGMRFIASRAATSRAQRASARGQNGTAAIAQPSTSAPITGQQASLPLTTTATNPSATAAASAMVADDLESSISRSASAQNTSAPGSRSASVTARPSRRKDKGKGKEIDLGVVRVKEEPKPICLYSPEPQAHKVRNPFSSFHT